MPALFQLQLQATIVVAIKWQSRSERLRRATLETEHDKLCREFCDDRAFLSHLSAMLALATRLALAFTGFRRLQVAIRAALPTQQQRSHLWVSTLESAI